MSGLVKPARRSSLATFAWADLEVPSALDDLARFVREGGVVVYPTESSYALGADATNADGVAAVFRMKRRPADKPLPVVVPSLEALGWLGVEGLERGFSGLEQGWPGPLTLILPCREPLPASCGRRDIAVRIPGLGRLRRMLSELGVALTATSANLAGTDPLFDLESLEELVGGERVLVIDGGRLDEGPPSTMVRFDGGTAEVIRDGATSVETLRELAPDLFPDPGFSAGAVEIPAEEGG